MTFFGFDEKAVDAERQKLYDSFRKAEEFDKLPPEERQETHRQMCREMLINSLRTYQMLEKYMKTH